MFANVCQDVPPEFLYSQVEHACPGEVNLCSKEVESFAQKGDTQPTNKGSIRIDSLPIASNDLGLTGEFYVGISEVCSFDLGLSTPKSGSTSDLNLSSKLPTILGRPGSVPLITGNIKKRARPLSGLSKAIADVKKQLGEERGFPEIIDYLICNSKRDVSSSPLVSSDEK